MLFSSSFCSTQILDFWLKLEKNPAVLLLLGSSIGLGGAFDTRRDETSGLTLSMKNLVLVAFLEHQWRERERGQPGGLESLLQSSSNGTSLSVPRGTRHRCLKSELGQPQWSPLPKTTQQIFLQVWELILSRHLDYFWESVRHMHFLPMPSKTFKSTLHYYNVYEHCELFISSSPFLFLNHSDCCICHSFHIRERCGKSYCISIPDLQ